MMFSPTNRLFLAGLALALIMMSGCASKGEVSSLQGQVSYQQQQQAKENQELKKQIVTLESELSKARQDLKQEISQTNQPVRSKQADLWVEIESLRTQLATARGEIDGLNRKLQRLEANEHNATTTLVRLTKTSVRTDRAVTAIAGQLGMDMKEFEEAPSQTTAPAAIVPASEPATKKSQPKASAKKSSSEALYKKALNSFYAKDYSLALSLWDEFATTFKKDKLVPNALFWQGECHYQMRDYARAILAYQKVIEKYKKSNKYRSALLKQGMSFFLMNKKKPGRLVLQDLIKKYPKSVEARRAKAYLRVKN